MPELPCACASIVPRRTSRIQSGASGRVFSATAADDLIVRGAALMPGNLGAELGQQPAIAGGGPRPGRLVAGGGVVVSKDVAAEVAAGVGHAEPCAEQVGGHLRVLGEQTARGRLSR